MFYTDPEVVNLNERLSARGGLGIPEVLDLRREHCVLCDDVAGIYRGQPGDSGVYVQFISSGALELIKASDYCVQNKDIKFNIIFLFVATGFHCLSMTP